MGEATRRRNAGYAARRRALSQPSILMRDLRPAWKPDKGQMNGSCNREACQAPGATWFNSGTRAFYCGRCAHLINKAGFDNDRRYGRHPTPICENLG